MSGPMRHTNWVNQPPPPARQASVRRIGPPLTQAEMLGNTVAARMAACTEVTHHGTTRRLWWFAFDPQLCSYIAFALHNGGPTSPLGEPSPVLLAQRVLRCEEDCFGAVRSKLLLHELNSGYLEQTVAVLSRPGVG
jgi:hypothetical protein